MHEKKRRTLAKAISYRIICIIMLSIITYLITGNLIQMTSIVVIFQSFQTIIYYFHEQIWEQVKWGYYLEK